jgi:hypothetical protein
MSPCNHEVKLPVENRRVVSDLRRTRAKETFVGVQGAFALSLLRFPDLTEPLANRLEIDAQLPGDCRFAQPFFKQRSNLTPQVLFRTWLSNDERERKRVLLSWISGKDSD